jgi:hypothetical protein
VISSQPNYQPTIAYYIDLVNDSFGLSIILYFSSFPLKRLELTIMNECSYMWEKVLQLFKILSKPFPGRSSENHVKYQTVWWSLSWKTNLWRYEHKTTYLTITPILLSWSEISTFYGTRWFIIALTKARNWTRSWSNCIQIASQRPFFFVTSFPPTI